MAFPDIKVNWKILLLSFVLACGLWYTVTVRDRLEVQAEVALNYRGMPENLIVRDGMLKSFTVQLRGPRELVKGLDTKMLNYSVDLSHLRHGTNIIALSAPFAVAESRALDVMGTVPNQLVLEVEGIMESTVPLEPRFSVPALAQAMKAENLHASPASISLRGPESVIKKMNSLKLDVPLELTATGDYQLSLAVSTPPQVTATPSVVVIRYSIAGKRTLAELERVPLLDAKNSQLHRITPKKVLLTVELPEGLMGSKSYLEKIRVIVNVKDIPPSGSGELTPAVELPEGARLVGISPAKLSVTKNGK
ncbi:MAG: hypothetical protein FWG59_00355 [Betaproteobacteria bacterium]|nr:hypothetical protein [Betaproteobacteria bacterium]